jgi:hypothetical protein
VRDRSVSEDDLAVEAGKQKLAILKDRPGYLEAMRPQPPQRTVRVICGLAAACCAALTYGAWIYVAAAWLKWIFVILFGLLTLVFLLAVIGTGDSFAGKPVGGVVLAKRARGFALLREDGRTCEISAPEGLLEILRPGDLGVAMVSGDEGDYSLESFRRL